MDVNQTMVVGEKSQVLNKMPYWILLLVTFLVPVFFLPISSISIQFGTSLLFAFGTILTIVIYVVGRLITGSLDLPTPSRYILGFTAIVPFVYLVAGISNGFSRMTFLGYTFDIATVGFILLGFSYLFLVSLLFREKKSIFYSYLFFLVSSILLALFISIRLIWGAEVLSFGIFKNTTLTPLGSFNNLGIFFGIGLLLSLFTFQMVNTSKLLKVLLSIAITISLFFLALVNFTFIWGVLAVCMFIFILYSVFAVQDEEGLKISFSKRLTFVPIYPTVIFALSIIFVVWSSLIGGYLSRSLDVTNLEVRPDFRTTMGIAINTIKEKPIFGSGPNTFVNQWLSYRPDEVITSVFWNTDFTNGIGLIPTFAVTTGIAGVLSWILFLGFYVYLGIKSIFIRLQDSFIKYLLVSSFFTSLFLWVMTFVYVPSTVILILTFFFTGLFFASVYLSGIISVETKVFSNSPRKGFVSSLGLVSVLALSSALGYGLWKNSESLWYFQKSSFAINTNGDISASESFMLKAIEAVPNDIYFRALAQIEIAKLNAVVAQDPNKVPVAEIQQQFGDVLSNAIKASIAAKDVDPDNYLNWISLGQVYEAVSSPDLKIEGAYESAELAYKQALERNPKNPAILALLARLEVTKGDLKKAKGYSLEAIKQKRNYLDAYFLLAQIEVADKNIRGAIDSVTAATVIDPTNPAIFFQLGVLKYNIQDFTGAIVALEKASEMTPDYANAKYFLGLAYEITGKRDKAIQQFEEIQRTNPDNKEVEGILTKLKSGEPLFETPAETKTETGSKLPVKENIQ